MFNEVTAEDVAEMLREAQPAGSLHCELQPADAVLKGADIHAVLRLVYWEDDPETGQAHIRDVIEQMVLFVPEDSRDSRARVAAFIRAWAGVVAETLTVLDERGETSGLMPHDLVHPSALQLARAETEEHFERALRVASRLGGLLGKSRPTG